MAAAKVAILNLLIPIAITWGGVDLYVLISKKPCHEKYEWPLEMCQVSLTNQSAVQNPLQTSVLLAAHLSLHN